MGIWTPITYIGCIKICAVTANLHPADSVVHFDLSALSSALNRETDWYLKLSNGKTKINGDSSITISINQGAEYRG